MPISGIWEKMGQAHTIEKLRGFAYKPLINTSVFESQCLAGEKPVIESGEKHVGRAIRKSGDLPKFIYGRQRQWKIPAGSRTSLMYIMGFVPPVV